MSNYLRNQEAKKRKSKTRRVFMYILIAVLLVVGTSVVLADEGDWNKEDVTLDGNIYFGDIVNVSTTELYGCYVNMSANDYGIAYYNGSWYFELVDTTGTFAPNQDCSITVDTTGMVHTAYSRQDTDVIKYFNGTYGSWSTPEIVYSGGSDNSDSDIEVDSTGEVSIVFRGYAPSSRLGYAYGTYGSWSVIGLYTGSAAANPVIKINSTNDKHIVFQAYHTGHLRYYLNYTYGDVGSWNYKDVNDNFPNGDTNEKVYPDFYLEGNNFYLTYRIDSTGDIRYTNGTYSSWDDEQVGTTAASNSIPLINNINNTHSQITVLNNLDKIYNWRGHYSSWVSENIDTSAVFNALISTTLSGDNLNIIYYDDTSSKTKMAYRSFGGIPGSEGVGFVNVSYETPSFEMTDVNFDINLNYSQSSYPSVNVSFTYDGTTYYSTLIASDGDIHTWRKTLTMADVSTSTTYPIQWNATGMTDRFNYTNIYYHTVSPFLIDDCSSYSQVILNVSHWEELNISQRINSTLQTRFTVKNVDGLEYTSYFNFTSAEAEYHEFCSIANLTNYIISDVEFYYYDNAEVYAPRTYYLINSNFTSNTTELNLYSLNDSESVVFQLQGLDQYAGAVQQGYIMIQKYYVGEGTYRTVEVSRLDDDGLTIGHLDLYDHYYTYVLLDSDGEVLYTTNPSKAYCTVLPCKITIIDQSDETFRYAMEEYEGVTYSLTFNDSGTNNVRFQYVDATGQTSAGRLYVYKQSLNGEKTTICNTSVSSSSATILCNMTAYVGEDGEYIANVYLARSPDMFFDNLLISINTIFHNFGLEGLIYGLLLLFCFVGVGLHQPIPTLIFTDLFLITTKLLRIISLPYFAVISLIAISIIIMWAWREN